MGPITGVASGIAPIVDVASTGSTGTTGKTGGPGFLDSLKSAIGNVNDAQREAGRAVDALMTGDTQDIHRTMVALHQAEVWFQLRWRLKKKPLTA